MILTWQCDICKSTRPDQFISVMVHDRSAEINLPARHFEENVKYCNDNTTCLEAAKNKRLIKLNGGN